MNLIARGLLSLPCLLVGPLIIVVGSSVAVDLVGLAMIVAGLALLVNVMIKAVQRP